MKGGALHLQRCNGSYCIQRYPCQKALITSNDTIRSFHVIHGAKLLAEEAMFLNSAAGPHLRNRTHHMCIATTTRALMAPEELIKKKTRRR